MLWRVVHQARESHLLPAGYQRKQSRNKPEAAKMLWHVVFAEPGQLPRSRAARSRDAAIHAACELLAADWDVRRILEPNGSMIERTELDAHYDGGRFPGLRHLVRASEPVTAGLPV
jgi:hypothetical protein